jgi:hypothetical protein
MPSREWLLRTARAAAWAAVLGVALTTAFHALHLWALDTVPSGIDARRVRFETLPKAEEFGWLVGGLAFVALALTPLPAERRLAWALPRAAAGALAVTLPLQAFARAASMDHPWFMWAFVAAPAFVALMLPAMRA